MHKADREEYLGSADVRGVALALDLMIDIEESDAAHLLEVAYRAKALQLGPEVDAAFRATLGNGWREDGTRKSR